MKKTLKAALFVFLFTIGLAIGSCKRGNEIQSSEFTSYIKAYTGGLVHGNSTVRIEFTDRISKSESLEKPVTGLFKFTPPLKGQTVWTGNRCVEFIPENMIPGQEYKVTFALDKVAVIDNPSLRKFRFGFSAMPREASLTAGEVVVRASRPDEAILTGKVVCSEPTTAEHVSGMLKCSEKTEIKVNEGKDNREFLFRTAPVAKSDEVHDVFLWLEDRNGDFRSEGRCAVRIPAKGDFHVTGCEIVQDDTPYILVTFSEPIARRTDPEGLVSLDHVKRFIPKLEDNLLKLYFDAAADKDMTINISGNIKNEKGKALGKDFSAVLDVNDLKPAVAFVSEGNILPDSRRLTLPFKAVNLSAVDISVIQIFENNVLSFLQENTLDGNDRIRRAGRMVYKKTLRLDTGHGKDLHKWQDFAICLDGMFKREPGAIYRIRLSFRQEYSLYGKHSYNESAGSLVSTSDGEMTQEDDEVWDIPSPYYYGNDMDWSLYQWKDRNNPNTPSYYMESSRMPEKNLLASNLGIIAKRASKGNIWVNINDIMTTDPVSGAEIKAYNYQLQEICSSTTDKNGETVMKPEGKVFIITARKGETVSYLRLVDGENKSTSRFDTSGETASSGLKGYIYGERGVWRPGDTLHVTFVLNDRKRMIPDEHPVTMEIYTPQGQFFEKQTSYTGRDGFHTFSVVTSQDSPTGLWNAYFKVGGSTFHKSLRIETIKPNRIKIRMPENEGKILEPGDNYFDISANWLTGPAASGLKTTVEVTAKPSSRVFDKYKNYKFMNPVSGYCPATEKIAEAVTDLNGHVMARAKLSKSENMPGPMKLTFVTKVHENAGDVSIAAKDYDFSPFKAYVGVKMPEAADGYLSTDQDNFIEIITVDKTGKALQGRKLEYKIYKLEWSWWWERQNSDLDSYINNSSVEPYDSGIITSSAKGNRINLRVDYPEWGRFLVCVKDVQDGHISGGTAMIDWPSWRGRSDKKDPEAITMLSFSLDKKSYTVGENAVIFIPAAKGGRALVSLENGSEVIDRQWVRTDDQEETKHIVRITENMAPNFYVHITLLQPYENMENDMPIRMYGVQPVMVTDRTSRLHPVISSPEVIRPQEKFKIKVCEKDGRPMTYTLAIVDEGLLDITSFKTPDPWNKMYAKEALGINTWDLYDDIMGVYGGKFASMFAIGGDESVTRPSQRDNRFNPVVRFIGPFTAGKEGRTHEITLPMYVGSVRIMVVAGKDGAYGNAEKTVPVRSPLMILSTLPRILSTGETAVLPVNVFALENKAKDVKVSVSCQGNAIISSPSVQNIAFSKTGDKICRFSIKSGKKAGKAKITVTAEGGGFVAKDQIDIEIRNPQPYLTHTESAILKGGESRTFSVTPFDATENEWVNLDISGFPAIDFEACMDFASSYKYDCSEQLSSIGMTMLALKNHVSEKKAEIASERIPLILKKLYGRQTPDGGFSYWPETSRADEWVTSMAGEFMIRAAKEGYAADNGVLVKWKKYQQRAARRFISSESSDTEDLIQAYRLYTLALAAEPENGAMNRLKEKPSLSSAAAVKLASAYSLCGKQSTAISLLGKVGEPGSAYGSDDITFGSSERDIADRIEALTLTGDLSGAIYYANALSKKMEGSYFNTQTLAFASQSLDLLSEKAGDEPVNAKIQSPGTGEKTISSLKAHIVYPLDSRIGEWTVTNTSADAVSHVRVSVRKQASAGESIDKESSGLSLSIRYTNESGESITPRNIRQGSEFSAEITVLNTTRSSYKNLVLDYRIPSGWEIYNESLFAGHSLDESGYNHKDIRDDGALWFFDLEKGESKTFRIRMLASYEGEFTLPATVCEAMYSPEIRANSDSGKVTVTGF